MTRLRTLRRDAGISMRELAALAGVSLRTIHSLETGKSVPRYATQRRLLHGLGMAWEQRREVWPA